MRIAFSTNGGGMVSAIKEILRSMPQHQICSMVEGQVPKPDWVFDFSHPSVVPKALDYCAKNQVRLLCGTTGITKETMDRINDMGSKAIWSPNFDLSFEPFVEAIRTVAKWGPCGCWQWAEITERHHPGKVGISGTALFLKDIFLFPMMSPMIPCKIYSKRDEGFSGSEHSLTLKSETRELTFCHQATLLSCAQGALARIGVEIA